MSTPRPWRMRDATSAALVALTGGCAIDYIAGRSMPDSAEVSWPGSLLGLAALACLVTLVLGTLVMNGRTGRVSVAVTALAGATSVLALAIPFMTREPFWSPGSDRAEALEIGIHLLLSGRNPYEGVTSLGNTLSPMVGGMLLAAPLVVLTGSLWLYGPLWLAGFAAAITRVAGWRACATALTLLAISPAIRLELVTRSDGWINAAALVVFGTWGHRAALEYDRFDRTLEGPASPRTWSYLASAALFGYALAYRFTLSACAIPILVVIVRECTRSTAVRWIIICLASAGGAAALPWLADSARYAPLSKLAHASSAHWPGWGLVCALVTTVVLALGSHRVRTIPGAWAVAALSYAVMLAMVAVGQGTWSTYPVVSSAGGCLIFAVAALVLPPSPNVTPAYRRSQHLRAIIH